VFRKLNAIMVPDMPNVRILCRESVVNQGKNDSVNATDAPSPNSTRSDGSAQHSRVLRDVNNER
jgi:hypothetical protein